MVIVAFAIAITGCKKKDDNGNGSFNRAEMLEDVASRIIKPSYNALKAATDNLGAAFAAFEANSSAETLVGLHDAFLVANAKWQDCAAFEFGPAMDQALRGSVNIFPTSTQVIEANISAGNYNLGAASNVSAKGFPAIDYLLFADDISTTVAAFANANRMQYLKDVIAELSAKITTVQAAWENGYADQFVSQNGNDVGSSLGELVNQLNFQWELIKNPKIGIPLGKKSLGQAFPEKVEGYYSGLSLALALQNARAIQALYLGTDYETGTDVLSLDDYLKTLGAEYNGQPLHEAITQQLAAAIEALEKVPAPLSETIINNPAVVDEAYVEIQKTVVLLKTDMPSALGVLITYQDNDGD